MEKKKTYWLSPKIKWRTYKELWERTSIKDGGPIPKNFQKILWEMLRDRQINIFITSKPVHGETWFPTTKEMPAKCLLLS